MKSIAALVKYLRKDLKLCTAFVVTMNILYEVERQCHDGAAYTPNLQWFSIQQATLLFSPSYFDIERLPIPWGGRVWFMTICIPTCDIGILSEEHERSTNC